MKGLKGTVVEVVQAMVPVTTVVIILQFAVVRMPLPLFLQFLVGSLMSAVGMLLFFVGVKAGLLPLGQAIGNELPKRNSLLFIFAIAFLIGFAATIAEPNVVVLSGEVESLSNGGIPGHYLTLIIAIGLGFFVALAMVRIVLGFPMAYVLAIGYSIALVLAFFAPAHLVPIAFDGGGFSTGLMTIPFAMALGIGLSSVLAKRAVLQDGFGVIGLACLGPVIGVLLMGIITG